MINTERSLGNLEVLLHLIDQCDDEENLFLIQLAEILEFQQDGGGNLTDLLKSGYVEKEIRNNGNILFSIEKENQKLEIVEFTKARVEYILEVIKEDMMAILFKNRDN